MIRYLGCETARPLLEGFVDGELPMEDQVAVESHLRWCPTCVARVEDLRLIGASLRLGSADLTADEGDLSALDMTQADVLSRLRIERDQSLEVRVRTWFQDMRLLWPALGATAAVAVCLVGAVGVLHAATEKHPHSLAGTIEYLADTGSDFNPLPLDARILAPRALNAGFALDSIPQEEAAFALATTVTREGRISNYELRFTYGFGADPTVDTSPSAAPAAGSDAARGRDLQAILDAVKSSRFEPAQAAGGEAVAVNMVWLVARTTVRARPLDIETRSIRPMQAPVQAAKPADLKPAGDPPRARRSAAV